MRDLFSLSLTLLVAGLLAAGCGEKKVESAEVPQTAPEPVAQAPAEPAPMGKYTVERHDTLWGIAGKSDIYSDSFQWPLIFKVNRDQIADPDLIHPRQDLSIKKDVTAEEVASARDLASRTPKYVPHTKPRETLPIDYF
jgi:LysM repeat protein